MTNLRKLGNSDPPGLPALPPRQRLRRTADEVESVAMLAAYASAGGNFSDTADAYSGGESETIIGKWMADHGNRSDIVPSPPRWALTRSTRASPRLPSRPMPRKRCAGWAHRNAVTESVRFGAGPRARRNPG